MLKFNKLLIFKEDAIMSDAVIQTLFQVVGGGVFGFLVARYTASQQKIRKRIAYKTSSIQLLELHEDTPDSIKVSVDKAVITGDKKDSGVQEPIKNATAHSIILKNKGNSTASELYFEVKFEDMVNILAFSSTPSTSESYKIGLEKVPSKENILKIYVPYLNPNDAVSISIVASFNASPTEPEISGRGKEVEIYKFKSSASISPVLLLFSFLAVAVFAMFEASIVTKSIGAIIPQTWVEYLGGTAVSVQVQVTFPRN